MENEKYIITIDGPDCTGKSTLWSQANTENKNIQIRGIVSNIAYAMKYNRNVQELLDLYNLNPVNYVVYLLNPSNEKKLEMLYNRIRDNFIYDNVKITEELKDASDTWKDIEYFNKAIALLEESYKGKIKVIDSRDNNYDNFKEKIKDYNIMAVNEVPLCGGIKLLKVPQDVFEKTAKKESEFKYIMLIDSVEKEEVIHNLYDGLDDLHKQMFDTLLEYADLNPNEIYDYLEFYTVEELVDYLDSYEFRCDVNIRVDVNTDMECYIPLKDLCEDNDRCIEDYIYNDSNLMDDVYDAVKDYINYCDDFEINVERVR